MKNWEEFAGGTGVRISAFIGFVVLILSAFLSKGAPQQAAGAAIGVGLAVIPYIFLKVDYCKRMIAAQKDILDAIQKQPRKD